MNFNKNTTFIKMMVNDHSYSRNGKMGPVISKLQSSVVRIPLENPVLAPQLRISYRDYFLVEIECNDGSRGIGFSYVGTGGGRAVAAIFDEFVPPIALGVDPLRSSDLLRRLKFATRIQSRGGVVMNALSALDIAVWDRNARVAKLPLAKFICSKARDEVPCYASGGYIGGATHPLENELQSYIDAGFNSVKIKCAFGSFEEDQNRVRAARRALGDEVTLMLDAYNRWETVEKALPSLSGYREVAPYWIEDPLAPDLLDEMFDLSVQGPFHLATGEFYFGSQPFRSMAMRGGVKVFQAEAPRCGGITEWLEIASIAQTAGIEMSPCWFHDLHVHLVAATSCAKFVEYFPTFEVLNFGLLIDNPVRAVEGMIEVPTRPGLGFDFLPDQKEKYSLQRAREFSVLDI